MGVSEQLSQTQEFQQMASQLGLDNDQAVSAADALLPAIMGGFQKQVQSDGGMANLGNLGGLMGMLGGGGLFGGAQEQPALDADRGNQVLGQIFGSKDVSRTVAQNAAQQTGLDASLLKKMLPVLVSLVTAYMARQGGTAEQPASGGGLGGMLGGLLGGGAAQSQSTNPLSGIISMLDANGDGNPLDDIMRMAGKSPR